MFSGGGKGYQRKRLLPEDASFLSTRDTCVYNSRLDLFYAIIVWADRLIAILRLKLEDGRLHRLNLHGYKTQLCVE